MRHSGILEGFVEDRSFSLGLGGMSKYLNMQRCSGEALQTDPEMGKSREFEGEMLYCCSGKDPECPHQEVLTVGL